MLREMLRQPGSKSPDAHFESLLHNSGQQIRVSRAITNDLQHRSRSWSWLPAWISKANHSMDWFFEQWVRGTGHPALSRGIYGRQNPKRDLPFAASSFRPACHVPSLPACRCISTNAGHHIFLGMVTTSGPETVFHFKRRKPHRTSCSSTRSSLSSALPIDLCSSPAGPHNFRPNLALRFHQRAFRIQLGPARLSQSHIHTLPDPRASLSATRVTNSRIRPARCPVRFSNSSFSTSSASQSSRTFSSFK